MTTSTLNQQALEVEGERLGRELPRGSVVWLEGPLGAGKTTLVRAIVRGRGIAEEATSPTYALVHHYEGPRRAVYHVDCYRLRHPDEAADLDWGTMQASDLLLIEWPERAGAWAPKPTHSIRLSHAGEEHRTFELT